MAYKVTICLFAVAAMLPTVSLASVEASVANARRIVAEAGMEIDLQGEPTALRDLTGKNHSFAFVIHPWRISAAPSGNTVSGVDLSFAGQPRGWQSRPSGLSREEIINRAESHLRKLGLEPDRDYVLGSVVAAGDKDVRYDSDAIIGAQRVTFRRPDSQGFANRAPVASFTFLIENGRLLSFRITEGVSKPPSQGFSPIPVREAALKARQAATIFAERTGASMLKNLPGVDEIERTVKRGWAMSVGGPDQFPHVPMPSEMREHMLPSYSFRVGALVVSVRADNGDVLSGGLPASDPTPLLERERGMTRKEIERSGTSSDWPPAPPHPLALTSSAKKIEPADSPHTTPMRATASNSPKMPDGLVAMAGGVFALILGAWAIWVRRR